MKGIKKTGASLAALAVIALGAYYIDNQQATPTESNEISISVSNGEHLELPAITAEDTYIVEHEQFTSSYNTTTLIPNWVAYELLPDELDGDSNRDGKEFKMDPDLRRVRQAMREDYSGSGWTKGHMTPATDARWSDDAMAETFYFTNICPQDETLNGGDWQYLEKQVRNWARKYKGIYVVSGPIVDENIYGTIGEREVTVPDAFFKAVLVHKGNGYSAIGFVMTNDDSRQYLRDCAMTINELEYTTGIDFFPGLNDNIEEAVESQYNFNDWGIK